MMAAGSKTLREAVGNLLMWFILASMFNILPAMALYHLFWQEYGQILHTLTDIICVIIALSAFLIVWSSHERSDNEAMLLAYGLLASAFFGLLHIYFYPELKIISTRYHGLSTWFAITGRLVETAVLLVVAMDIVKVKIRKRMGLAITLVITSSISFFYIAAAAAKQSLLAGEASNMIQAISSILTITLIIIALHHLSKRIGDKDIITYKYLFMALVAFTVVEICFALSSIFFSFVYFYAHLIKVIGYYYIYKGVFVSVIHYPYDRLEEVNAHGEDNIQLQTRAILDAISQPLVLLDKNRKTSLINKCLEEMLAISGSEYLNIDILDFPKLFKITDFEKIQKDSGPELQYTEYEVKMETPGGKRLDVSAKGYPIFDVDNEIIGWIVVGTDITRLEEERQRMQQQEKLALIGQMAAGIVHEIKNPLATIKGFNQMIKLKIQDEKIQKYTQTVENAINDLSKVANEFLSFAKPRQMTDGEVLINPLLESMQLMICSHTFTKGIRTSFIFSEREESVIADGNQIKQVVLNLCENAIDALTDVDQPMLSIMTLYDEIALEMLIVIEDNGKGMTQTVKEKIGTPFFTTKEKGTGLGLSVCYQIINKHHGRIELQSEPDKGTRFVIVLPCSSKAKESGRQ